MERRALRPPFLFGTLASVAKSKGNASAPSEIVKRERIATACTIREIVCLDGTNSNAIVNDNVHAAAASNH